MTASRPHALALALAATFAVGGAQAASPAPVFDVHELDPAISACQDFNAYANGKWIAANPIPCRGL